MTDPTTRTSAIVVLGTCLVAAGAAAQQPWEVADGFRDSAQVAWTDAQTRCVTELRTGFVTPATDSSCRVVNLVPLGAVGMHEWHVARYRRVAILADSFVTDTMQLDELALFARVAGAPDARLRIPGHPAPG
jgi:hypothetical protein